MSLVRRVRSDGGIVGLGAVAGPAAGDGAGAAVTEVLLAEGGEALLLGHGVDVGADDEGDDVEEGHPGGLGQELLGEGEAERRGDPRHLHHLHEADAHRRPHLVEGPGARDQRHGYEVHDVLDGGDL